MFIKYGEKEHLIDLFTKGKIYFNTSKNFHKYELKQAKGLGDKYDSYFRYYLDNFQMVSQDKHKLNLKGINVYLICAPCLNIPIFCIKQTDSIYLTATEYKKIQNEFPH